MWRTYTHPVITTSNIPPYTVYTVTHPAFGRFWEVFGTTQVMTYSPKTVPLLILSQPLPGSPNTWTSPLLPMPTPPPHTGFLSCCQCPHTASSGHCKPSNPIYTKCTAKGPGFLFYQGHHDLLLLLKFGKGSTDWRDWRPNPRRNCVETKHLWGRKSMRPLLLLQDWGSHKRRKGQTPPLTTDQHLILDISTSRTLRNQISVVYKLLSF